MEPELIAEFDRVLSRQPAEALAYAFACWREVSAFLPAISDIRSLLKGWHRNKQEIESKELRNRLMDEREAARARGELVDFSEVKSELLRIAKWPESPQEHQREFSRAMERMRKIDAPPAVALTKEQLAELANPTTPEGIARKAREREQLAKEIQRLQSLDRQKWDGNYEG